MENESNYFEKRLLVDVCPIRSTHQANLRILKTRDGRQFIGKMENSSIKKWIQMFTDKARAQAPDKPFEGPLELTVYFGFPLIKSDKGKDGPMVTRPDFDNLAKSVCDALTDCGFWHDDSQVVFGKVMKFRTKYPFVGIHVKPATWIDSDYCDAIRLNLTR